MRCVTRRLSPLLVLLLAGALGGLGIRAPAAFARGGERSPGGSLGALLQEWKIVATRVDARGREEQASVLARIADLRTPDARRALGRIRDDFGATDPVLARLILEALLKDAAPAEVDATIAWVEGRHAPRLLGSLEAALGEVESPATLRHLREDVLPSATPPVKAAVASALGRAGDREAVTPLLFLLRESNADVRLAALYALGRIGDPRAGAPLAVFLHDPDWRIRAGAARALGGLATGQVPVSLREALSDSHPRVVEAAANALGRLEDRDAVGDLVACLVRIQDEDLRVADAVARALQAITGRSFGVDKDSWKSWWDTLDQKGWKKVVIPKDQQTVPARRYYGFTIRSSKLVFVLDVSRSMGWNERLETAKAELIRVLHELPPTTRFNIITFSDRAEAWQGSLRAATPSFVRRAISFVERQRPDNGTNTWDALAKAFSDADADTIYFLSDGTPSVGAGVDPDDILYQVETWNRYRHVVIDCVALLKGDPPPGWAAMEDRSRAETFMRKLAKENDGEVQVVK